jgi:Signal peptidase I
MKTVLFLGHVPTESMEPTLKKDSFILGTRLYGDLIDGDIIIFERHGRLLVKRIAASGGEAVVRNGITLIVPDNCYYARGDNDYHSYDSRFWTDPCVQESSIEAKLLGYI